MGGKQMQQFIKGVDLSTLLEVLACGAKYYDHGQEADVLNILKRYDIDSVRLRLWNDPYSADGKSYGAGTNDMDTTIKTANKIKDAGSV